MVCSRESVMEHLLGPAWGPQTQVSTSASLFTFQDITCMDLGRLPSDQVWPGACPQSTSHTPRCLHFLSY